MEVQSALPCVCAMSQFYLCAESGVQTQIITVDRETRGYKVPWRPGTNPMANDQLDPGKAPYTGYFCSAPHSHGDLARG
ncbi:hypothetical protein BGW80DRAFT_593569 [Lactifluus volemus]|nr:hypothetical protein BGW80DRAFT_593569 [Lactifluus volemus]